MGNIPSVHIDREERSVQVVLEDTVRAIERAVGLGVQDPVAATKVFGPGGGAGLEEIALEPGDPEVFLAGAERCFYGVPEEGLFVRDDRDWDPLELLQDTAGEGTGLGGPVEENAVNFKDVFEDHGLIVPAPPGLEKRKMSKPAARGYNQNI